MESVPENKVPLEWEHVDGNLHRLKIGEIFQFSDSSMSMTCINCSREFQYFTEFSLHIQEHFTRGDIASFDVIKQEVRDNLSNLENEIFDTELIATGLEVSADCDNDDGGDDDGGGGGGGGASFDEPKDHSEAPLPEPNCEMNENEDFNEFGSHAGDWSDNENDFNENDHSIFGCDPKLDNKQQEAEEEHQQQEPLQFIDGTDYEKCNDKFKCLTCDHECDKWEHLKEHLLVHMSPQHIKCPVCLKVFSSVAYTRTHCLKAHNIRVSGNKIKEAQSANNPVDIATLEEPTEPKPEYKQDIDYKKVDQKFQCITCHRVMAKLDHMKEHLVIHNSEKNVYCPLCNKTFITESYVRKHVNRAHKKRITEKEIRAAQPTVSKTSLKLENASTTAEETEQRQQLVGEGGKSFVEGEDYEKSNGRFKCLTCGRIILDHIREHLQTHSNEKNVYCPLCDKAFIAVSYVRKHVNRAHKKKITAEEIKNAQINIDAANEKSKEMTTRTNRKPIKMVPTIIQKNFECFDCHRPFTGLGTLRTHMKLHRGIQYSCQHCSKQFARQSYLHDHIGKMHKSTETTKSKVLSNCHRNAVVVSFKCNQCQISFDSKQTLRQHTKTHTNGPFLCVTCGAVYKFKANLKSHMEMHQAGPNNRQKCLDPSCQKTFPIRRYMLSHYRTVHRRKGKQKNLKSNKKSINSSDDDDVNIDDLMFIE